MSSPANVKPATQTSLTSPDCWSVAAERLHTCLGHKWRHGKHQLLVPGHKQADWVHTSELQQVTSLKLRTQACLRDGGLGSDLHWKSPALASCMWRLTGT